MRSLFFKIFLWFWGAMILIGLALFLVVTTTQPDPLPEPWRESTGAALASYASAAATAWEEKGRPALAAYLAEQESNSHSQFKSHHSRFQLFDDQGHELSGRGEPPRRKGRFSRRSRFEPPPGEGRFPWSSWFDSPRGPPPSETWQKLRQRALQSDEAIFALDGPFVQAAQSVKSSSGRRYVLQAVLRQPHFGRPAADPRAQWLGVLVVLTLSGLVCYGLVRYLTAPMVSLRAATQRLAAGDLAARTGAAQRTRRDEVADLGRDFDAMAERIEALVVAQRRLLGDISHELRSPLSRLSMALALARRRIGSDPEALAPLDRIKREAERLNTLIGQLLQLTRLESGEVTVDAQRVDLERLLREVAEDADYEAHVDHKQVRVAQSLPCHTTGSQELLRSAIENVVRNAVRHTKEGTTVQITLAKEATQHPEHKEPEHNSAASPTRFRTGTMAVIRVRDHGEGVPEEALAELFRPFYRVEAARDRESGGVGLGLAITERAVRSHGGTVTAANAPDGGLLVEIRLPSVEADSSAAASEPEQTV